VADRLSTGALATLSLLDTDQGVCPDGHRCVQDPEIGYRACATCSYRGLALICWEATPDEIEIAAEHGADSTVIEWAHAFVRDRWPELPNLMP
jgi:hypothetical protein